MPSLFTKIVNGEIPCFKIFEDDNHLAFLDIMPLAMGHVLCIPKKEIDYIYDLPSDELAALWKFTIPVAKAISTAARSHQYSWSNQVPAATQMSL